MADWSKLHPASVTGVNFPSWLATANTAAQAASTRTPWNSNNFAASATPSQTPTSEHQCRDILATRRAERARWLHDLHAAASAGDASAIAFLKAKHKPKTTWNHLIGHSGSQPSAIQTVKDHFQQLFAKTSLTDRSTACASHLATLQAHMATTTPQPISSEELIQALTKLKMAKTSGSTGMSNEFLLALGHTDAGELLLRRLLNTMLVQGDIHVCCCCWYRTSTCSSRK